MPSLDEHINARNDPDLLARVVAAAEQQGITGAQQWAYDHMGQVVSTGPADATIADAHAYAVATYDPTPRPGENPAAVTDEQIIAAVTAVAS